jgi:hypothetical protein
MVTLRVCEGVKKSERRVSEQGSRGGNELYGIQPNVLWGNQPAIRSRFDSSDIILKCHGVP